MSVAWKWVTDMGTVAVESPACTLYLGTHYSPTQAITGLPGGPFIINAALGISIVTIYG